MNNSKHTELCEKWIKAHKLNRDDFNILTRKTTNNNFDETVFVFVYNIAFSRPFLLDSSTISELILASDLAFQAIGVTAIIETDKRGNLSGKSSWTQSLINELDELMSPRSQTETNQEKKDIADMISDGYYSFD